MSIGHFLQVLLAVAILLAFALLIGMLSFGVARWGGAEIPAAIASGAMACGAAMMIGIALLTALLTDLT